MKPKDLLRHKALAHRSALNAVTRQEHDRRIAARLRALTEYREATCILFYVSFGEEVDTHPMIEDCFGRKQRVLVPRVDGNSLVIHEIASLDDLQPGAFGVMEPVPGQRETAPAEAAVVIVPGAAFDRQGHRIGYGKGYYDRLLASTRALKIGLAYDAQFLDKIPAEKHDITMDLIVTEAGILDLR